MDNSRKPQQQAWGSNYLKFVFECVFSKMILYSA